MELSNAFVCIMGMGVVFIGLIIIVYICKLLSFICIKTDKVSGKKQIIAAPPIPVAVAAAAAPAMAGSPEFELAIRASAADANGVEIASVRILSVKKL